MGRKSRSKNTLGHDLDELMDLDVNKKAASPKLKKAKAMKKAATAPALKRKPSALENQQNDGDEDDEEEDMDQHGFPPLGGASPSAMQEGADDDDDDDDDDAANNNAPAMEDMMAAIMNAVGRGAGANGSAGGALPGDGAPPSRSALFNAMFGGGAGGGPHNGAPPGGAASASAVTGRFADMLKQLNGKNQDLQMIALQDLSEELSVATEDMFMGYGRAGRMQGFSTQEFTTTLLKLISPAPMDDGAFVEQFMMDDDDFGGGGSGGGHMTSEIMLLSCRCLSNLIEANPGAAAVFVQSGGVGKLVEKLREIEYIELAEQVLQVLEKVCVEYPHSIIKENGFFACLQYLDFFSLHVQRTAVSIVAKSCKGLGVLSPGSEKSNDTLSKLQEILPILESLLTNGDSRIVDSVVSSVESIVHWSVGDEKTLESLVTSSLIRAVMTVLRPSAVSTPMTPFSSSLPASSGTPTISGASGSNANSSSVGIFTQLIRVLVDICKGSTKLSVELLNPEYNVTDSIYSYLTGGGSIPNPLANNISSTESGILSNMVMNSIVSRGTDQVIQVLVLACELFPAIPKVGVEWCMKVVDAGVSSGVDDMEVDILSPSSAASESEAKYSNTKKKQKATTSTAPIPTRTLRSNSSSAGTTTASTKSTSNNRSNQDTLLPKESFDTRRRNLMDSTPTTKTLLETYALYILPILIEVFSTSVHPTIRRLSVETIAKCVWFAGDGPALGKVLLEARGFGKFVYELLGMRKIAFKTAVVATDGADEDQQDEMAGLLPPRSGSALSAVNVADRDRAESLVFVSAGVQLTSIVVSKCGAKVVGWLIREGILTELRKSVEELEALIEMENQKSGDAADQKSEVGSESLTKRVLRSASGDRKGKGVAVASGASAATSSTATPAVGDGAPTFLEGVRSALERMTGALGAPPSTHSRVSGASLDIGATIIGLNGEKYSEHEAKQWLLQFATVFLTNLGENKALLAAGTSASFDVLTDLKRVTGVLKSGKKTVPAAPPTSPSKETISTEEPALVIDGLMMEELQQVAKHFAGVLNMDDAHNVGVTGFEVLESGIIDALTIYLTRPGVGESAAGGESVVHGSSLISRLQAFLHVFLDGHKPAISIGGGSYHVPGAFKHCISRLQECLTRVEDFKLTVAVPSLSSSSTTADSALLSMFGGLIGGNYSQSASAREQASPALQLARQIKLRLVCEEPETVPVQFRNAVISIHAVATIKTFEDFMKGKVAGNVSPTAAASSSGIGSGSAAVGVVAGSEKVGKDEVDVVRAEKNDDDGDDEDDEEEVDGEDEYDEEMNVLKEMLEADEQLNEGRPSSAGAVDLITPASPTKKKSHSRATSPAKSVASSASASSKPVITPAPVPAASFSSSSATAPMSYAGAATSLQNSFNIKFFVDGVELKNDETIFGALYRHEQLKSGEGASANIWNKTFTIKYKKVAKELPTASAVEAESTITLAETAPTPVNLFKAPFYVQVPPDLDKESKAVKILVLLKVLFVLNTRWHEVYEEQAAQSPVVPVLGVAKAADGANANQSPPLKSSIITPLPPVSFINNKVTAKLNRQLNEPLIVASSVLPVWCNSVAVDFSFLVPFESRVTYLQSTAFGYARCINRWKANEPSSSSNNSGSRITPNSFESALMGARIQRQKVRVSRTRLIDSMTKVMELYGRASHSIEVEFFDEVGTGLGPTLEFYSSVCKEMRKREGVSIVGNGGVAKKVVLWRENGGTGDYLNPSEGLFPAPIDENACESEDGRLRLFLLKSLGSFVAKALLDARIVDMPFSALFLDMAVAERHVSFGGGSPASFLHLIK
ncbi:UNVERIFIED_CONTAM: Ubiquitin fusion degradation protein 4, partial [Siphonaria sp. JEL0065]